MAPLRGGTSSGAYEVGRCSDRVLRDHNVTTHVGYITCEHFWVGPDVRVLGPSGNLVINAGYGVILRNGFSVEEGGALTVRSIPGLIP